MSAQTLETVPMLVGGRWEESRSERFGEVFNPSTGREIARVPLGTAEDVDRAVTAAAAAPCRPGPRRRPWSGRVCSSGFASGWSSRPRSWPCS